MDKKTIGIIGCGNIGAALAIYAEKELKVSISGIVLYDIDPEKVKDVSEKVGNAQVAASAEEVIDKADVVVEAASPKAVPGVLGTAIEKGKDIILMSIGGVLANKGLLDKAREKGIRVILPSGAISGIDALKSARLSGIESVTITTRKAPRSIKGAPYLSEKGIDVDRIEGEETIFEGNALEAIKGFPKNVNVSALLSLAGIGAEKTRVRIVVSPSYTKNIHEIEVVSGAGKIITRTENVPSPENPKTSYLAVLSAITALRNHLDTIRIGN